MRRGIQIEFSTELGPANINFDKEVQDFASVAQNGVINIVTRVGSDQLHPDKGTDLLSSTYMGYVFIPSEQNHLTALAAEQTRLVIRQQEIDSEETDNTVLISKVGLEIKELDLKKIVFNVYFVSVGGQEIGIPLNAIV